MNKLIKIVILGLLFITVSSCNKEKTFFSEPYEEGASPLDIKIDITAKPNPEVGAPGTTVTFKISGMQNYENAKFRFNGRDAEILSITKDEVQVKVPEFASTGVISIVVDDKIVFGPKFTVQGVVRIDPTWQAVVGSNGAIRSRFVTPDGKSIFVGEFTNYNNRGLVRPINRLVRTFQDGMYDVSWSLGQGANGAVNEILQYENHYYIAGSFSGFAQRPNHISNMTRIFINGVLDSSAHKPFRTLEQLDTTVYMPTFNGGFNSAVSKIYLDDSNKIIASGNFRYHIKRRYDQPNKTEERDTVILDSTEIRHVARLLTNGDIDKTFRFDASGLAFPGGNGNVNTLRHNGGEQHGKILVYGQFNRFDNKSVGYITRLNADGTIDDSFNNGGVGADYYISHASFNNVTQKYVIVGSFRNYNGTASHRMAVLNADGSIFEGFKSKEFVGGNPNFAKQLSDGKIVVSGGFNTYAGITRIGFMILDDAGNLIPELNTTGEFSGSISEIYEDKSEDNRKALLLIGRFNQFDSQPVGNIVRIILE